MNGADCARFSSGATLESLLPHHVGLIKKEWVDLWLRVAAVFEFFPRIL